MTTGAATVRVVGRYALYQAVASGGMATVFLGRLLGPVGFSRTVAIKRLHAQFASDPKFVSMFLDEAKLAARIRHPNVVPTLDVVATGGELFLVLEYVHGESLARLMRVAAEQDALIPVPIVLAILSGALQGLDAAHEAKTEKGAPLHLVHRDVSPQNILLGRDGQARILDFGVARASVRLHTTQAGEVKGKVAYMPPEQLRGEEVHPATDVYSAAVVLWEALVGRRLFQGRGEGSLVVEVLEAILEPPSRVLAREGNETRARAVEALDDVVMRALEREWSRRWQTARDFSRALEAAAAPATVAQVSDWIERVAGQILSERAAMVADIESSNPVPSSNVDLDRALAASSDGRLRSDLPRRFASAPPAPNAPPLSAPRPATSEAERPSKLPSYGASSTAEVTVRDVPAPTILDGPRVQRSSAEAASGTRSPQAPFKGRIGPTLPSAGAFTSESPRLGIAREPGALAETLQSVMSPMADVPAEVSVKVTLAPPPSWRSPSSSSPSEVVTPRRWVAPLVVAAVVIALVPVLAVLAYTRRDARENEPQPSSTSARPDAAPAPAGAGGRDSPAGALR